VFPFTAKLIDWRNKWGSRLIEPRIFLNRLSMIRSHTDRHPPFFFDLPPKRASAHHERHQSPSLRWLLHVRPAWWNVPMSGPSKTQVNKAGSVLRRWRRGEPVSVDEHLRALDVLLDHRGAYRLPLNKATMSLRSVVKTEQCKVEVSQRLKRVPTIVDKLVREPTMKLASMQDIGGCRAVLNSFDEVRRVQRRLSKNRTPLGVSDYISAPRRSGYRGIHVVVQYDGRPVEVQLRTQAMHEWAITVERLGGRLGEDLKSGKGPQEVLKLLEGISEVMALEEQGEDVSQEALDRLAALRQTALPILGGGRR
jgi:putative GTP pyrophosphokinase